MPSRLRQKGVEGPVGGNAEYIGPFLIKSDPCDMFLAQYARMLQLGSLVVGAAAGAMFLRERRIHLATRRFGAATLETLLKAIDANDEETGRHVRRVAAYGLILAEAAGLDRRTQRTVEHVALFHDIGKIHEALFDLIHDPTRLTSEQRRAIATHPQRGAEVLAPLRAFYPQLADGVLAHHERWDGSGYPCGLRGHRIPLSARLVAIVDTFDAITHRRRYQEGRTARTASGIIGGGRGTHFDPALVDLFLFPPVFESIVRAMRNERRPRARSQRREHKGMMDDITFRWRSVTPAPPVRGRTR